MTGAQTPSPLLPSEGQDHFSLCVRVCMSVCLSFSLISSPGDKLTSCLCSIHFLIQQVNDGGQIVDFLVACGNHLGRGEGLQCINVGWKFKRLTFSGQTF